MHGLKRENLMDSRKRRHTLHPSPPSCKQLLTNLCNPRNPGVKPPTNLPRSLSVLPSFHGGNVLAERFAGPEGRAARFTASAPRSGYHCRIICRKPLDAELLLLVFCLLSTKKCQTIWQTLEGVHQQTLSPHQTNGFVRQRRGIRSYPQLTLEVRFSVRKGFQTGF